jgi:hypothetical protein
MIIKHGGLEMMMRSMSIHKDSILVQRFGCANVYTFAANYARVEVIRNAGCIKAVITAMNIHKQNADVQRSAVMALQKVAPEQPSSIEIVQYGGIKATITAMKKFNKDTLMMLYACRVIQNVAAVHEPNSASIMQAGGLDIIMDTMVKYQANADVLQHAISALWNMTANTASMEVFCRKNCLPLVIKGIHAHKNDVAVARMGCLLLQNLAKKGDLSFTNNAKTVDELQKSALSTALMSMRTLVHESDVQDYGCKALSSIMQDCSRVDERMQSDVREAVLRATTIYSQHSEIQKVGGAILRELERLKGA